MTLPLDDIVARAESYRRNCEIVARAQYLSADELRTKHLLLGIPALLAATAVGTTIFGTLQSNPEIKWKIATGLIAMFAGFLSALQTSLNFSERGEKHKSAGASYSSMRREFEIFTLRFRQASEAQRAEALTTLEELHQQLAKLGQETPSVPDRHWDKANTEMPAPHNDRSKQDISAAAK
jgi:hypothetical protein